MLAQSATLGPDIQAGLNTHNSLTLYSDNANFLFCNKYLVCGNKFQERKHETSAIAKMYDVRFYFG